jgi:hypothetical protein
MKYTCALCSQEIEEYEARVTIEWTRPPLPKMQFHLDCRFSDEGHNFLVCVKAMENEGLNS